MSISYSDYQKQIKNKTIPQTIEQIANQLASGLNKKNPKTLADFLSSAAGQAIQYSGVLASTKAEQKIKQINAHSNSQSYNIVRSSSSNILGINTNLVIIIAIGLLLYFSLRRK